MDGAGVGVVGGQRDGGGDEGGEAGQVAGGAEDRDREQRRRQQDAATARGAVSSGDEVAGGEGAQCGAVGQPGRVEHQGRAAGGLGAVDDELAVARCGVGVLDHLHVGPEPGQHGAVAGVQGGRRDDQHRVDVLGPALDEDGDGVDETARVAEQREQDGWDGDSGAGGCGRRRHDEWGPGGATVRGGAARRASCPSGVRAGLSAVAAAT